MTKYKMTPKGADHKPSPTHNVVAWGAIRELIRLTPDGVVSEEQIEDAMGLCFHSDGADQKNRYLNHALKNEWLKPA